MGEHLGFAKVFGRISERYTWKGMRREIRKMCMECHRCATCKDYGGNGRAPLIPTRAETLTPFQRVGFDLMGPLPKGWNGEQWIIVCMDYFTKWPVVGALKTTGSKDITDWIRDNVLTVYGVPEEITTDRGVQMTSEEFKRFVQGVGMKHTLTSPFSPATDGLVERHNRTLLNSLRCFTQENPEIWPQFLQTCAFAYRASRHSSSGYSPFELLQCRIPRLGMDVAPRTTLSEEEVIEEMKRFGERVRGETRKSLERAADRMKEYYDSQHHTKPSQFIVGQRVYWKRPAPSGKGGSRKLHSVFQGPFEVTKILGPKTVSLKGRIGQSTAPTDQLKLSHGSYRIALADLRGRGRPKKEG